MVGGFLTRAVRMVAICQGGQITSLPSPGGETQLQFDLVECSDWLNGKLNFSKPNQP